MKKILLGIFLFLLSVGVIAGLVLPTQQESLGVSAPDAQWIVVNNFSGYQTKSDPSKIDDGGNPQGQNTIINNGDRVSVRPFGSVVVGDATTTEDRIHSLHTFRRRDGENILIRGRGEYLEYLDKQNITWEIIGSGYTTNTSFGFADFNINTDQTSYVYFGNAHQAFSRWTGQTTHISSPVGLGDATINVDDTSGFSATGTIYICNTAVTYTGVTATTFTGATGAPVCATDRAVAQGPQTFPSNVRGNIYLAWSNRLFIAGITSTPQAVYFSQYGDASDFVGASLVTEATADAPGIFNLAEGGGAVTGMVHDEGAAYLFKKSIIYRVTLDDALYTLRTLKPFDGKSQTTGSVNPKLTFTGGNGVFFVTPDNQIMNLSRVESVDYPQIVPISDSIKPTTDVADFNTGAGIYFEDNAYISAKATMDSVGVDSTFLFNFRKQTWESPIVGWSPSTFAIYDDGTGEALYFGDDLVANVYKIGDEAIDNELGIAANWRSKQFDFGLPATLKEIENIYIEGYITDNTNLTISLLLDENGVTQRLSTVFRGTETGFQFSADSYNVFGFHPFGTERFGTSDASGKRKFRIYLNKNLRRVPFYVAQLEFASDGIGEGWEITRMGFRVREHSQPENRNNYREFN